MYSNRRFLGRMCRLLMAAVGFLCLRAGAAREQEPQPVLEARSGIVRVRAVCTAGSDVLEMREHTGFLVGEKEGEPYILTTAAALDYSDQEIAQIRKEKQLEENVQIGTGLYIIFQGDTRIDVSIVGKSERKDLAILKPGQTLTDKFSLEFSENEAVKGETAYLLCFPSNRENKSENYSDAAVTVAEGRVRERAKDATDGTRYFTHNIRGDAGTLGGPFLDQSGHVLGIYVQSEQEREIALTAAEMMEFMDLHTARYATDGAGRALVKQSRWPTILAGVVLVLGAALIYQLTRGETQPRRSGEKSGPGEKQPPDKAALPGKEENGPWPGHYARGRRGARLLYLSRQETIGIDGTNFLLGTASGGVNYRIGGNRRVSRVHAAIRLEGGHYYLEDMNSTNGTALNSQEIAAGRRYRLEDGDTIDLAEERFVFRR